MLTYKAHVFKDIHANQSLLGMCHVKDLFDVAFINLDTILSCYIKHVQISLGLQYPDMGAITIDT